MSMRTTLPIFNLIFIMSLFCTLHAAAQGIYKWEDENGKVHFSNSPPSKEATPTELPKIMKGEVKIPKTALRSCDGHGGINCESGPDSDGSVICYDGFKEAASRYRFSCLGAKLEVADISKLKEDGSFVVSLRNRKSVTAQKVEVTFTGLGGKKGVILTGPSTINSLSTGDYTYSPSQNPDATSGDVGLLDKPTQSQISISCLNCG